MKDQEPATGARTAILRAIMGWQCAEQEPNPKRAEPFRPEDRGRERAWPLSYIAQGHNGAKGGKHRLSIIYGAELPKVAA
jgi:hypothetical protein